MMRENIWDDKQHILNVIEQFYSHPVQNDWDTVNENIQANDWDTVNAHQDWILKAYGPGKETRRSMENPHTHTEKQSSVHSKGYACPSNATRDMVSSGAKKHSK